MQEIISSEKNEKIKYLKKIYRKKGRKRRGKFILEGYRILMQYLDTGLEPETVFITPAFASSPEGEKLSGLLKSGELIYLSESLLKRIADTISPQGVIAVVDKPDYRVEEIFRGAELLLLLDRIQDPGNMGTIIRTAVAAGVDGIIILKGSVDIYNLKVLRSTMGAIFNIPIISDLALADFMDCYQELAGNFQLVSTILQAGQYYNEPDYNEPLILVVGNEAGGIREEIIGSSDLTVKLPLIGEIDSLNVAVAAGVVLYKIIEKRHHIFRD